MRTEADIIAPFKEKLDFLKSKGLGLCDRGKTLAKLTDAEIKLTAAEAQRDDAIKERDARGEILDSIQMETGSTWWNGAIDCVAQLRTELTAVREAADGALSALKRAKDLRNLGFNECHASIEEQIDSAVAALSAKAKGTA